MLQPPEPIGDDTVVGLELHRLHVDIWILPDLRIHKAGKQHAEQAFGKASLRQGFVLQNSFLDFPVLAGTGIRANSVI